MRRFAVFAALFLGACGAGATTTTQPDASPVGDWELIEGQVVGVDVPEGDFRITLLLEGGTAGGVAACNSYGGSFTADDGFIQFGLMSQTEMACAEPAMTAEQIFLSGLAAVDGYTIANDRLMLTGTDVTLVFAIIPPIDTAPLFDQRWVLESLIRGDAVSSVQGDGFLLLTEEGTLSGSTGCRNIQGVFIVVADEIVPTEFSADGNCPPELGQQDSHFTSVIEGGFSASVEEDRLTLLDPEGSGLQFRAEG
jgi:heat shock protein HslJ